MWHYILMALGWIIKTIYSVVQNYGVAIILFTIVVKLLLLPLNIKSQKAMKKQQKIQPLLAELQKKYANDQQKLQQEMMKLYKENDVSMMGGCLPMLLQMPILIALYQVLQRPLTYVLGVPATGATKTALMPILEKMGGNWPEMGIKTLLGRQNELTLAGNISEFGGKAHEWFINFDFLGLDLSKIPNQAFNYLNNPMENLSIVLLLLIPILAVISSVLQNKITMKMSGQDKKNTNDQAQAMGGMMKWLMPVMTGWFTLILPAGMGLYWIISGVVQIIQQLALNYYFDKKGEDVVVKVPEKRVKHGKNSKKH